MFHLDEYVGISSQHPGSFRMYLKKRLIDKVHPREVHLIEGDSPNLAAEVSRLGKLISQYTIDAAFIGVGENGHVAFNDPPADFETDIPFLILNLDEACRKQQVGEGWFSSIEDVPRQAITMSIKQIMKSRNIICVVPESRKAEAIRNCFGRKEITPMYPASILRKHPNAAIFLDRESASLLDGQIVIGK
jgi:glucosamine-6-phosphate deaminase